MYWSRVLPCELAASSDAVREMHCGWYICGCVRVCVVWVWCGIVCVVCGCGVCVYGVYVCVCGVCSVVCVYSGCGVCIWSLYTQAFVTLTRRRRSRARPAAVVGAAARLAPHEAHCLPDDAKQVAF